MSERTHHAPPRPGSTPVDPSTHQNKPRKNLPPAVPYPRGTWPPVASIPT